MKHTKNDYLNVLMKCGSFVVNPYEHAVINDLIGRIIKEQTMGEREFNACFTVYIEKQPKNIMDQAMQSTRINAQIFGNKQIEMTFRDREISEYEGQIIGEVRKVIEQKFLYDLNKDIEAAKYDICTDVESKDNNASKEEKYFIQEQNRLDFKGGKNE